MTPRSREEMLQDLSKSDVAANKGEHGGCGWIGELRLRTGRRTAPEHRVGPRRRCGPHRACGLKACFGQLDLPILRSAQRR